MKKLNSKSAFSLVELLVVVSIISIIVGFAAPSYRLLLIKTVRTEAKVNLTHMYNLHSIYIDENEEFAPSSGAIAAVGFQTVGNAKYNYSLSIGYDWTKNGSAPYPDRWSGLASKSTSFGFSMAHCSSFLGAGTLLDFWAMTQDRVLSFATGGPMIFGREGTDATLQCN